MRKLGLADALTLFLSESKVPILTMAGFALLLVSTLTASPDRNQVKLSTARRMTNLHIFIDSVSAATRAWPPDLAPATRALEPARRISLARDGWGTPFRVGFGEEGYRIRSAGRDRRFGSFDDMARTYPHSSVRVSDNTSACRNSCRESRRGRR